MKKPKRDLAGEGVSTRNGGRFGCLPTKSLKCRMAVERSGPSRNTEGQYQEMARCFQGHSSGLCGKKDDL